MAKYLKHFPQPFLDDLVAGRCVPFVGAGFSRNATLPSGGEMPLWDELGKSLSSDIPDYEYTGPIDAISAYAHEYSRVKLVEQLHRLLLVDGAQPTATHRAFCSLSFDLVITTNIEFLLERAYESVSRYCRPILEEDHLVIDAPGPEVKLLKLHGDLHHPDRLVVTEDDYDSFLDRFPLIATYLASLLVVKTPLFIGYSLDDPDFRQTWQIIGDRLGKLRRPAYAITVAANPHTIARFERRGVKSINLPGRLSHYPEILESAFRELSEHWSSALIQTSTTTDDESVAELALPSDATGRLCFFSVPHSLAPFYREMVFPIAERHGFAPVTAFEVIAPGDSITAKISALMDKAEMVVIDSSSRTTRMEFEMAVARAAPSKAILLIAEEGVGPPSDVGSIACIVRPERFDWEWEDNEFLSALDKWFGQVEQRLTPQLNEEPMRLLAKREYRAALISAFALLESRLQRCLDRGEVSYPRRRYSVAKMLEEARDRDLITAEDLGLVMDIIPTRNRIVHQAESIRGRQASRFVKSIMEVVQKLP